MTVEQLITQLRALKMPDARVVMPGFDESDLDDLETILPVRVVFDDTRSIAHSGRHHLFVQGSGERSAHAVFLNFG